MIASRWFGTAFHVTGSAATQKRRIEACAGAAATATNAMAAASTATARSLTASADLDDALHPCVDATDEVQPGALLGAEIHLLRRLRRDRERVSRLIDARRAHVDDRLRRVSILVERMRREDRLANRPGTAAAQDPVRALRHVLLGDDRKRVRRLALVLQSQRAAGGEHHAAGDEPRPVLEVLVLLDLDGVLHRDGGLLGRLLRGRHRGAGHERNDEHQRKRDRAWP